MVETPTPPTPPEPPEPLLPSDYEAIAHAIVAAMLNELLTLWERCEGGWQEAHVRDLLIIPELERRVVGVLREELS